MNCSLKKDKHIVTVKLCLFCVYFFLSSPITWGLGHEEPLSYNYVSPRGRGSLTLRTANILKFVSFIHSLDFIENYCDNLCTRLIVWLPGQDNCAEGVHSILVLYCVLWRNYSVICVYRSFILCLLFKVFCSGCAVEVKGWYDVQIGGGRGKKEKE